MVACPVCHTAYDEDGLRYCSRCGGDMNVQAGEGDGWVGRVVEGRYRVLARIGAGGMGAVYRVEHVRMGKVAAMKVLHRELAGDAAAVKRFRREVEAVSRLNHPNIVQTFDFGQWEGLLYLIMEYVLGEDLGTIVRRDGPLPLARALPLFSQVASALDEAHHLGVVHRDLKPENIVAVRRRNEGEHAKVLDFGLAKLRERPDLAEITGKGSIIGTPYFMAPEQVRSEPVDARTDVYSLGATLYRVLTGCHPFEGDSPMQIVGKHLTDPLIPPSRRAPARGLTAEVDEIVCKAMAREPGGRYASVAELRQAIERAAGLPVAAPRSRPSRPELRGADEILAIAAAEGPDEVASHGGHELDRLRREDLDAFDRRPRRRRMTSYLAVPALLVVLGSAAGATYLLLGSRPNQAETEPNDEPRTANLLPRNAPVTGRVDKPRAAEEPDLDYYRIPAGEGRRAVTAHLAGIPDLDLILELYDDKGERIAKVDGGRKGDGEWLGPIAIGPRDAYLRARPLWTAGEPPTEGSATPYTLTVDWGAPAPDTEIEPNDEVAKANPVGNEGKLTGYLSSAEDQDWFVVRAPEGMMVEGEVEGIDGVDLVLHVGRAKVDEADVGDDEEFTAQPDARGRVVIGVGEQIPRRASRRSADRAERDEPYTLKIRFRPAADRRR